MSLQYSLCCQWIANATDAFNLIAALRFDSNTLLFLDSPIYKTCYGAFPSNGDRSKDDVPNVEDFIISSITLYFQTTPN